MATLYKRASPLQKKLLRMVEGAVKNTIDAHGMSYVFQGDAKKNLARSIAKRAVGTITSNWEGLLALDNIAGVTKEAETLSLSSPAGS